MDVQQFEQAILKMAFETDARITTASVAYYLGIPSNKANKLLNQLVDQGVLELDSDDEGNLYFVVPQKSASQSSTDPDSPWRQLEEAADAAVEAHQRSAAQSDPPSSPLASDHFQSSIDDASSQPLNPNTHSPSPNADGRRDPSSRERQPRAEQSSNQWGQHQSPSWDGPSAAPPPSTDNSAYGHASAHRGQSRYDGIPDGVASRLGRPDATVGNCGSKQSVIVDNAVSCEPRPLADAQPTVTSCNDVATDTFSTHNDLGRFGFTAPQQSTALATRSESNELTLRAHEDQIEQPEHQPGMALLLSLILCGTGQIYNGEVSKGIIMLILHFLLWFVFLGWIVHIWSIVDAVVVAERINRQSGNQQSQPTGPTSHQTQPG